MIAYSDGNNSSFGTGIIGEIESVQALPVELINFSVNQTKNGMNLTWQTATEINNYGFEIQRQELNLRE